MKSKDAKDSLFKKVDCARRKDRESLSASAIWNPHLHILKEIKNGWHTLREKPEVCQPFN